MRDLLARLVKLWLALWGLDGKPPPGALPPPALVTFLDTARDEVAAAIDAETEKHLAALAEEGLDTSDAVVDAHNRASESKAKVAQLLDPISVTAGGMETAQAGIRQPEVLASKYARDERDARTIAATAAARTEARELGDEWGLMWVAHRDCCVTCLAYSGLVITSTDMFDGGLSFRAKERDRFADAIDGPPKHPNDRCHLEVVHLGTVKAASDALKREALRSGVLGWSLQSESDKARREAAQELLHRQLRLPKSVLDKAHRKLRGDGPFKSPVPPVR